MHNLLLLKTLNSYAFLYNQIRSYVLIVLYVGQNHRFIISWISRCYMPMWNLILKLKLLWKYVYIPLNMHTKKYVNQITCVILTCFKSSHIISALTFGPLRGFLVTQQIFILQLHINQSQPSLFCTISPQFSLGQYMASPFLIMFWNSNNTFKISRKGTASQLNILKIKWVGKLCMYIRVYICDWDV